MISNLKIKNFKSFNDVDINLNNFTLLTGMNSAGKSTIIQAILLAVQNVTEDGRFPLNGRLVSLGQFSDVRNFVKNAKEFNIEVSNDDNYVRFKFTEEDKVNCVISKNSNALIDYLHQKNHRISYISSKRIGSQDLYDKNYDSYLNYGVFGEYAIDYFENHKSNQVEDYLIKEKSFGKTLEIQVNYWLNYILNCEISTEDITGTDQVRVKYKYSKNRYVRPKHIGSGLSYIISLLISVLSSKQDDLIIIENPEIHLHPSAQSKVTEFLTFAAEKGIKLIIETHSDHIFNGVRKSIFNDVISTENLSVYFCKLSEDFLTKPVKIEFNGTGDVENHQKGLFDQFDEDLDEMLGL
jgi:predicted ATPase